MFYRPKDGHGLPHNPFNAIVTPRPIGWISTRASDGTDNLAPYSFFNATAYTPPQVMFASTGTKQDREFGKDSTQNIRDTGVFCVNIVSSALRDQMNISSVGAPGGTDEFALAGLEKAQCHEIDCARVAASPAALECRLTDIAKLKESVDSLKKSAKMVDLVSLIKLHQYSNVDDKQRAVKLKLRDFWKEFTMKQFEIMINAI